MSCPDRRTRRPAHQSRFAQINHVKEPGARPARCAGAEIAHEIALTHEVMALWDEVLPGRVMRVRYEELVADQARGARPAGVPRRAPSHAHRGGASRLALHGGPPLTHWAGPYAALQCCPLPGARRRLAGRARARERRRPTGAPGGGAQAQVSRRLLKHVGLPWEERVMDFHATQRTVQTASLGQACSCSLTQPYL